MALPVFAHEFHRTRLDSDAYFEKDCAAQAGFLHRLQIGFHALAGKMAVHKIPVDPGARLIGRMGEIRGHAIRMGRFRVEKHMRKTNGRRAKSRRLQGGTPADLATHRFTPDCMVDCAREVATSISTSIALPFRWTQRSSGWAALS